MYNYAVNVDHLCKGGLGLCVLVGRLAGLEKKKQKLLNRFPPNFDGGCVSVQNRPPLLLCWICQYWPSLGTANRAVRCRTVSTDPTRVRNIHQKPAGSHFIGLWLWSCCSSSHKEADAGSAAGLMSFYSPVQLPLCNSPSHGISSVLWDWDCAGRLHSKPSYEPPMWMWHPGRAGLLVQPDWAAGTTSCCQQWQGL